MTEKTWFITGVSSGFGRLMLAQLLARGDRVAGTVRHRAAVADLAETYPDQFLLQSLDLSDINAIKGVVDAAFTHFGQIDVIVNNAGYGLFGAAEELQDQQIVHQIATNVMGSIQVVRAALPHLRAQGGGRIMQLSSMGGQWAMPGLSLYHATKWAMEGFFESTIQDIAPFNIEVTLVEPGSARTQFAVGSAAIAPAMAAYAQTPAGAVRRRVESGFREQPGDPERMVRAMIASVDQHPAPKRLALGSDAYRNMEAALSERLASLRAQKELAYSTDFPAS